MSSPLLISIMWKGPLTYKGKEEEELSKNKDKGIYQIYGYHLVFGPNSLLYIGKTEKQTFSKRLSQHEWIEQEQGIRIYLGRVSLIEGKDGDAIDTAEELLIYVHQPPYNSNELGYKKKYTKRNFRIYNFGERMSLLPELSTDYWRRSQKPES